MTRPASEPTRLAVLNRESFREPRTEIHELALSVPADLRWLRGHFDGHPILPAVVQLLEVERHAREIWPDLGPPRRVVRAKFRRPIRPEDPLRLRLRRTDGDGQVGFEFRRRDEICSSGALEHHPLEEPAGD